MPRRGRSPSPNRPSSQKRARQGGPPWIADQELNPNTFPHSHPLAAQGAFFPPHGHPSQYLATPSATAHDHMVQDPLGGPLGLGLGLGSPLPYRSPSDEARVMPVSLQNLSQLETPSNLAASHPLQNTFYPVTSSATFPHPVMTPPPSGPIIPAVSRFQDVPYHISNCATPEYSLRETPAFETSHAGGAAQSYDTISPSTTTSPLSPYDQIINTYNFPQAFGQSLDHTLRQPNRSLQDPSVRAVRNPQTSPTAVKAEDADSKPECDICGKRFGEAKAVNRHRWEQHTMHISHFCPLCSKFVRFIESDSVQDGRAFECAYCEEDGNMLSLADIMPHFRSLHYHCLSSTDLVLHKRPVDYKNHHLKKKNKTAPSAGHKWIAQNGLDFAAESFQIIDADQKTLRGCDHCSCTLRGLLGFSKHVAEMNDRGDVCSRIPHRAFTKQVVNLLESKLLGATWSDMLQANTQTARPRWQPNGAAASSLLQDLERAAVFGADVVEVVQRAYSMAQWISP